MQKHAIAKTVLRPRKLAGNFGPDIAIADGFRKLFGISPDGAGNGGIIFRLPVPLPNPCHYVPDLNRMETPEALCFHNRRSQTVRLRFHGMEEVVSSNLTRSTKLLNQLAKWHFIWPGHLRAT